MSGSLTAVVRKLCENQSSLEAAKPKQNAENRPVVRRTKRYTKAPISIRLRQNLPLSDMVIYSSHFGSAWKIYPTAELHITSSARNSSDVYI